MATGSSGRTRIIAIIIAVLIFIIVILLAFRFQSSAIPAPTTISPSASIIPQASTQAGSNQRPDRTARLAWFYKPPDKSQLPTIAKNFDVFILTHKDEAPRDTLKSLGVKSPIFVYLLFMEIKDPGSCTDSPQGNQVAYQAGDFCEISQQHPDWFLQDQSGNRITTNSTSFMDPGNAEYQAFWLQRAKELQQQYHWDGIFIDNVEASLGKMDNKAQLPKYPDNASYQAAVEGFLKYLHENYSIPNKVPILANIISVKDWKVWLDYLQYLDGAMIENFAVDWNNGYHSPSEWNSQMTAIDQATGQGKTLILVAQAGKAQDSTRQQYAFASYLLVADKNVYFRYESSDSYRQVSLYDNYSLNLGEPLGPRRKDGLNWRRDFANGYVIVNPVTHSSEIKLNP